MTITGIIELIAAALSIGTALWATAYNTGKRVQSEEQTDSKINALSESVDDFWKYKNSHEKEANAIRLEFQKQMSVMETRIAVHDENYKRVLSDLSEIKEMLKDLRNNT